MTRQLLPLDVELRMLGQQRQDIWDQLGAVAAKIKEAQDVRCDHEHVVSVMHCPVFRPSAETRLCLVCGATETVGPWGELTVFEKLLKPFRRFDLEDADFVKTRLLNVLKYRLRTLLEEVNKAGHPC